VEVVVHTPAEQTALVVQKFGKAKQVSPSLTTW
jgi:hypothetical protein